MGKITVFYDAACDTCVRDRRYYEFLSGRTGEDVIWFDITGKDEELQQLGIEPLKALTELHIMDENHNILSELDAYIVLMNKVLLLKPLARLIGMPVIKLLLGRIYHWFVIRRLKRDGRL